MLIDSIIKILERDLDKLIKEVNAYKSEEELWQKSNNIPNSAGNLCLHLVGNLNHYIGATIGESGYVRKRDEEFSTKDASRNELILRIEETKKTIKNTLIKLSDDDLEKDYPLLEGAEPSKITDELLRIITHFNYHLGQINYHRRLLQND